jgi:hypothetical protein
MALIFIHSTGADDWLFFNISANVGPNCPNRREDVEMVQFGYFAASMASDVPGDLKPVYSKVVPGATYTGAPGDPLTLAIAAHERSRGGTQDGHVSKLHGTGAYNCHHQHLGMIMLALTNCMRQLLGRDFPRIDKHPKCPAGLAASIRRTFDCQ